MAVEARAGHDPDELRHLAVDVARDAGRLLQGYASDRAGGADLQVGAKTSLTDPVSEADRASERLIAERLAAARPDDGLLGEEDQAARQGSSGLTWVVDPLDGTVNFLYGLPMWTVSIAVVDAAGSLAGAVYDPSHDEVFHAARGAGARVDDRSIRCTDVDDLGQTLVATGFAYEASVRADQGRFVAELLPVVRDVRRGGSAALDLCWVAAGRFDAYIEYGLQPWDWAAGRLIVGEAGGVVSEHEGFFAGRGLTGVCAAGPAAHDRLVAWLEARS